MTIKNPGGRPTLADAARMLRVPASAMDEAFGVLLIDPQRELYAVSVEADALPIPEPPDPRVEGPFADVPIEPLDD
jgi:hypothetical protein